MTSIAKKKSRKSLQRCSHLHTHADGRKITNNHEGGKRRKESTYHPLHQRKCSVTVYVDTALNTCVKGGFNSKRTIKAVSYRCKCMRAFRAVSCECTNRDFKFSEVRLQQPPNLQKNRSLERRWLNMFFFCDRS